MSQDPVFPRVVRATSLTGFCQEVRPAVIPVRLCFGVRPLSEHAAHLTLSLQGVSEGGEIVWLAEQHTAQWLYGRPFGNVAESQRAAMHTLHGLVQTWLTRHGYEVRAGDYALPNTLHLLAADFAEVARWVKDPQTETWRVEAVAAKSEEMRVTVDPEVLAAKIRHYLIALAEAGAGDLVDPAIESALVALTECAKEAQST